MKLNTNTAGMLFLAIIPLILAFAFVLAGVQSSTPYSWKYFFGLNALVWALGGVLIFTSVKSSKPAVKLFTSVSGYLVLAFGVLGFAALCLVRFAH